METAELVREFKAHHTEVKAVLEAAGVKSSEIEARMLELEQKVARRGGGSATPIGGESWGSQLSRSEGVKHLNSNAKQRVRFEIKSTATLTHADSGSAGDAGALSPAMRASGIIELQRRKLTMRDVFSPGRTTANAVEWPRQTARSNNAATVAEGALKPQSDMTFDLPQWPVRTIATWMLASRQILDDVPALASIIDSELRYMLKDVEDAQLLNGTGSGTDLVGVHYGATPYAPPFVPTAIGDLTKLDVLLLAIAQVQAAKYEPDFVALNPLDWKDMLATKSNDGKYIGGGPFAAQADIIWKLPIVETQAMTLDSFLVGSGKRGAQIFDREDAAVEASTEDGDNFRRNLCTLLGEERLAFVVKHADAFVKGTFTTALSM